MKSIRIKGSSTIEEITNRVRDQEVARRKFAGVVVEEGHNVVSFVQQRVPPKPHFVRMGSAPPSGTSLDWVGEMQVEGARTQVQLYRQAETPTLSSGSELTAQIHQVQKALGVTVDGAAGPETWGAVAAAVDPRNRFRSQEIGPPADKRSERWIATLLPHVQPYARALYFKCKERGIAIKIIDGTRTFEQQDALWRKGRNEAGRLIDASLWVTDARGGFSNHNFGIAFDVGVFKGQVYLTDFPSYLAVGVLGEELGLQWGGRWKKPDGPHFQLRPSWAAGLTEREMVNRLRQEFPNGVEARPA